MSEIEFLTKYTNKSDKMTVIYAGAGPGGHINYLSKLFKNIYFVLIDPLNKNKWNIKECKGKIKIIYDYMTDEMAKKLKCQYENILFISDIRVRKTSMKMNEKKREDGIIIDNEAQKKWHEILNPKASLLKFRCPFYLKDTKNKNYRYLKGDIYLPVWGGVETCECRLMVEGNDVCFYDIKKYEEKMMYFNTETRVQYYDHNIKIDGICHCYDCRSEIHILRSYIDKYNVDIKIPDMIKEITESCSVKKRNLFYIEYLKKECSSIADLK
jgi:cap2 methyltransferase